MNSCPALPEKKISYLNLILKPTVDIINHTIAAGVMYTLIHYDPAKLTETVTHGCAIGCAFKTVQCAGVLLSSLVCNYQEKNARQLGLKKATVIDSNSLSFVFGLTAATLSCAYFGLHTDPAQLILRGYSYGILAPGALKLGVSQLLAKEIDLSKTTEKK